MCVTNQTIFLFILVIKITCLHLIIPKNKSYGNYHLFYFYVSSPNRISWFM